MKYKIVIIFTMFLQSVFSQETFKTSITASEVATLFSQKTAVEWAVPISQTEKLTLQWSERQTSLTEKEGIRTFVGYQDNSLIASLSIRKNNVLVEINWSEKNVHISTNEQGFLVLHFKENTSKCGTCKGSSCSLHSKHTQRPILAQYNTSSPKIDNSEILLEYRLALPISYLAFNDPKDIFKSDKNNVKTFWANAESFLNEIYMRDLGIQFRIVNNEKLIITQPSDANLFIATDESLYQNTNNINKLIGENSYDLGLAVISYRGDAVGLAMLSGGYGFYHKGNAWAISNFETIAHEIGHLFGSNHTFTIGGTGSYYTETGYGQSIMGYGKNRDFFSLVSIYHMRQGIAQVSYYEDIERKKLVKRSDDYTNYPYGIKTPNQPPIINTSKLKKEYIIPRYTCFQFNIDATDTNDKDLLYMAHPADIGKKGYAKFHTYKGISNNEIRFEPSYTDEGKIVPHTDFVTNTDATFWIGVSDGHLKEQRAVMYDLFETKVKVVFGTAFEIRDQREMIGKEYKVGEKITLKWNVDEDIFGENSKVRILLSDDLGKTYKHTIVTSTENDGECEFTIPNVLIGETEFGKTKKTSLPAGVFKVEVLDHIAYAITNVMPFRDLGNVKIPLGGFKIVSSGSTPIHPLKFVKTPENITLSCSKNIPEKENLQVTGGCNPEVKVTDVVKNQTCTNNYIIERTYTASDTCGSTPITHIQTITIKDDVKPTFNEALPKDTEAEEGKIPEQATLTATDNCTTNISVVKSQETKQEGSNRVIIYKWTATDECKNTTEHTQKILVKETPKPTPPTDNITPPSGKNDDKKFEIIVYNGVSTELGSENYFKIEPFDQIKNISVEIFNELGQKVYQSKNYQQNGEVFRGIANVSGVVAKGKRLPTGTYFYILKCQNSEGIPYEKRGFLFVR